MFSFCADPSTLDSTRWMLCYLTSGKHLDFYWSFGTVLLLLLVTAPSALLMGFGGAMAARSQIAPLRWIGKAEHRATGKAAPVRLAAGALLVAELMSHDIPSTLTVNNYFGVLQGVLNHLGIGVLPDYITEDFPHLVRVLPETESTEVPVFLAYPEELRHSKRVAAFREFVTEEIFNYRKRQQI